jgi:P2 family phage contractile tail tube protein
MTLPAANPIPEKLIAFRVYREGEDQIGLADVELPDLEFITETVSGAGVAGELESPVIGHTKSLALKLKWRTFSEHAAALLAQKMHHLDLRGSIQRFDPGSGVYEPQAMKVVVRGAPKKGGLGKFEMGKPMDNESEFEVSYIKVWLGGQEVIEVDKLNYKFVVAGDDALAAVRGQLGLET